MADTTQVLEYKCPCCDAGLKFDGEAQQLHCEYCGNSFELEAVQALADVQEPAHQTFDVDLAGCEEWSDTDSRQLQTFHCTSCGGELTTDQQTAATFCPFCGNPTVLPGRVSGGLKPTAVIPFQKTKEDAKSAFLEMCKGKPLLPDDFTSENHIEKITGIYVPFWLFDCDADQKSRFRATRVHTWADSKYNYVRTDHYLVTRDARAEFVGIPVDGSSKMGDAIMESIEPFRYEDLAEFSTAYLTGFFADKYDVPADSCEGRIRERAGKTMDAKIAESTLGYASLMPMNRQQNIVNGKGRYVLLPVWMLHSVYKGNTYEFAMNGQTGKLTGTLPIDKRKALAWFFGVFAGVTAVVTLLLGLL